MKLLFFVSFLACTGLLLSAGCEDHYEALYPRTPVGTIEIKDLPARTALEARSAKAYFDRDNDLFMTLFRYIKNHDVSMTVPVESEMDPGAMRFFAGQDAADRELPPENKVKVLQMPPRKVLSIGLSGSYSQKRFDDGKAILETWLSENPEWTPDGDAYGVYWNSPFVPNMLKRSEVHIPVKKGS